MKLSELHQRIKNHVDVMQPYEDPEVVIQIKLPYATVGGMSTVKVKDIWLGFDWDAGKFLIVPDEPLTKPNDEFAEKFKDMQDKCGWLHYENSGLKSEIKRLKKILGDK